MKGEHLTWSRGAGVGGGSTGETLWTGFSKT